MGSLSWQSTEACSGPTLACKSDNVSESTALRKATARFACASGRVLAFMWDATTRASGQDGVIKVIEYCGCCTNEIVVNPGFIDVLFYVSQRLNLRPKLAPWCCA